MTAIRKKESLKKISPANVSVRNISTSNVSAPRGARHFILPLLLFIVFIFLGLFFFIDSGVFREKNETTFDPLFPNFSESQVIKIEIARSGATVILSNDGKKWTVGGKNLGMDSSISAETKSRDEGESVGEESLSSDGDYPADLTLVNAVLSTLKELQPDSIASRNQEKYTPLGVDEVSALKVSAYDFDGDEIAALLIGKKSPTFTSQYVRKPQENIVYLVNENLSAVFEKLEWRDKTIVSIPKENIVKIVVKNQNRKVAFEKIASSDAKTDDVSSFSGENSTNEISDDSAEKKSNEEGGLVKTQAEIKPKSETLHSSENIFSWRITEPKNTTFDQTLITNILNSLSQLKGFSFAEKTILSGVDLEKDASSTKVWMQEVNGESVTLYFYEKDEITYAKRADSDEVFTVNGAVLDELQKVPY